jgi:hypothetical protein
VLRTYLLCAASYVAASASVCAALAAGDSWVRYPLLTPVALLVLASLAPTALQRAR